MTVYNQSLSEQISILEEEKTQPRYGSVFTTVTTTKQGNSLRVIFTTRNKDWFRVNVHPSFGPYVKLYRREEVLKETWIPDNIDIGMYKQKIDTHDIAPGDYTIIIEGRIEGMDFHREKKITLEPTADAFRMPWNKYLYLEESFSFTTEVWNDA